MAILTMMDVNESYTTKNSPLQCWLCHHWLVGVHMHLHDIDTTIPTYTRGTKRVDCIFGSQNIVPNIVKGGLLLFYFLTMTNHRGLYPDIKLQRFLRSQLPQATPAQIRALQSNHPRGYHKYCQDLQCCLMNISWNKIYQSTKNRQQSRTPHWTYHIFWA